MLPKPSYCPYSKSLTMYFCMCRVLVGTVICTCCTIKHTSSWEIHLICLFFSMQAAKPQVPRPFQRCISLGLYISVHLLTDFLFSFQASYILNNISVSLIYLTVLHFHAAVDFQASCTSMWHNAAQLCRATRWPPLSELLTISRRIAKLQLALQKSQHFLLTKFWDIICSILIRRKGWDPGEWLKFLWLKQLSYQCRLLHCGHCCVSFFCSWHKPGFGCTGLLSIAN